MDTAVFSRRRWFALGLALLCASAVAQQSRDPVRARTAEDLSQEVKREKIEVDESIFQRDWNDVPYNPDYFTYSDAELRERWDFLARGLQSPRAPVPFPSANFLRSQFKQYPRLKESVKNFSGDYQQLEARYLDAWRAFFAGRFQQGWRRGKRLGGIGELPALLCQLMYALYLTDRHSTKKMLLQDIINESNEYFEEFPEYVHQGRNDTDVAALIAGMYLVKTYAMARIAEEAPIPVIAARGYIRKIQAGADEVLSISPDQPLGLAFDAAVGAGIMRRMGKFTGRITYGARITEVEKRFARALDNGGDIPIVNYEYANALIYMSRKRELNSAMRYMEKAVKIRPAFSMDALDVMYSWKRLQEIRLYALNFRSFRDFDKARRDYAHVTDRNLTSVLTDPLTMAQLRNPEQYKLPPRE